MTITAEESVDARFINPVLTEAYARFKRCAEWEASWRDRFINDIKFRHGDSDNGYQWPNAIRRSRDVNTRPCLTMNIVRQHNFQITNELKKNKSAISILPVGNGATKESADALMACIRRIEYHSNAQAAYATGAEFMVDGGLGWWRIITKYSDDESFNQELFIWPVWDPLSVYMDPDCHLRDCSDAKFAFVFDNVPRGEFEEAYPELKDLASGTAPMGISTGESDWVSKDHIRICEYFRRVKRPDKLASFVGPNGTRMTLRRSHAPKEVWKAITEDKLTRVRDLDDWTVEWKLIVGDRVADETDWPGKYIPLVRCVGEEIVLDGVMDRKGHTRAMKDAQRMFNYNAALDIRTRIPTPSGWTTMGQLRDGDWIYGQNGFPVQVKKALPIREGEPCFKVEFDNGYSVITDAGHIWKVEERGKRFSCGFSWKEKTVSTSELVSKKHFVKLAEPIEASHRDDLPIDPYLLGMWLGDGNTASPLISAHLDDIEEEKRLIGELGYTVGETRNIHGNGGAFYVHGVRHKFAELGLLGDKHVPAQYMRASREQRLSLLQGLMDTDGHFAYNTRQCIFVNTDRVLVRSFMELCASLGIKAFLSKTRSQIREFPDGNDRICKEVYRVQFTADPTISVFRLARKATQQEKARPQHWRRTKRLGIVSVTPVESVPVRCIMLDTPDHLYLCGDGMIPTHNSSQVEFVALQSKTPYLAPVKAIEDYEQYWNTANSQNHAVLPYNHKDDDGEPIPPPQRQEPPTASMAFSQGMQDAFNQMMMVSGQWQNQMGMMGNERTGAAIERRQSQGDTATFHFVNSYQDAIRYTGVQLIDLIPKVYDTRRVLRCQADDGADFEIEIDPGAKAAFVATLNHQQQVVRRVFNPNLGKYEVQAASGPAYGTKREQTVEALTLILTQAPALTGIIGDLLLSAMDFDKAQEAAQRLKRMVPPQALGKGPTMQEQQMGMQIQQLQTALAKTLEEHARDRLKLTGKDQMRDIEAYRAETDRFKALADSLGLEPDMVRQVIGQLVQDALGTNIRVIPEENSAGLALQSGNDLARAPGPQLEFDLTDPTRHLRTLRLAPLTREVERR